MDGIAGERQVEPLGTHLDRPQRWKDGESKPDNVLHVSDSTALSIENPPGLTTIGQLLSRSIGVTRL